MEKINLTVTDGQVEEARKLLNESVGSGSAGTERDPNHWGRDKWLHRAACLLIGALLASLAKSVGADGASAGVFGFVAAMVAGLAKESYDERSGGKWDWYDLLADAEGAIVGCLLGAVM